MVRQIEALWREIRAGGAEIRMLLLTRVAIGSISGEDVWPAGCNGGCVFLELLMARLSGKGSFHQGRA